MDVLTPTDIWLHKLDSIELNVYDKMHEIRCMAIVGAGDRGGIDSNMNKMH